MLRQSHVLCQYNLLTISISSGYVPEWINDDKIIIPAMSTKNKKIMFLGIRARPVHKADLTAICELIV
jgi:hypothetical protein